MTQLSPSPRGSHSDYDVVCFSHLRWDFVFQRPQHLMSRLARDHRVFVIEEPFFDTSEDRLDVVEASNNVLRLIPHLSDDGSPAHARIKPLMDQKLTELRIENYITWFYTPMMLDLATGMEPLAVVYDVMDELSAF